MPRVPRLTARIAAIAILMAGPVIAPPPALAARAPVPAAAATPLQVYGAWHCGDDACTWSTVRDMTQFDTNNHWLIDRGDGQPSVNLVVLSFANPLRLLNSTTDAGDLNGMPRGMTAAVVSYFASHGVRVMVSIGGITYTDDWDAALAANPAQLAHNAAAVARQLGVGFEIDYENSSSPNLSGLQTFISTYRSIIPYDATGADPAARLTIDLAAGDRWLIGLTQKATADWLRTDTPVLDYANAMVPSKQPTTSGAEDNWQEHLTGKPTYDPPIGPLAPAKLTGSLYIALGSKVRPECNDFAASLQNSTGSWVQSAQPAGAGATAGLLGYMFWAAERPSTRGITTDPPNTCENGVGGGATAYQIPIPMPALRQS
jgi:hypothetical protein